MFNGKKMLSLFLVTAMLFGLLPPGVFAVGETSPTFDGQITTVELSSNSEIANFSVLGGWGYILNKVLFDFLRFTISFITEIGSPR